MSTGESCNLNGCIFGWLLFKEIDIPIAHHTGIIVNWMCADPWKSIVAHYGSDCTSRVLVETLKDAVVRSDVKLVRINPHYHAQFTMEPYSTCNNTIIPSVELLQFQYENPEYNVMTSNCQHFVKRFIKGIQIESDLFSHMTPIFQNIIHTSIFGGEKNLKQMIERVADSYSTHRMEGICAWDADLDLDVPSFKQVHT